MRGIKGEKTRPGFEILLALASCGAMVAWLWRPIRHANDIWWHLATGRYIGLHRFLPKVDVFSWTVQGHRWINHEWLFQLVLYGFYRLAGINGILILKILLIEASLFFVWWRLQRERTAPILQWIFLAAAFWVSRYGWNERADLVSLLFLSALFFSLDQFKRRNEITIGFALWPFFFALWANSHGGFVLGTRRRGGLHVGLVSRTPAAARTAYLLDTLCIGATFINPYGYHLHRSTLEGLKLLQRGFFTEWQRTPWHPLELFWLALVIFWASIALQMAREKRVDWPDLLLGALLSYSAVSHVRNVPYFMIGVFPWVARSLSSRAARAHGPVETFFWKGKGLCVAIALTIVFAAQAARGWSGGIEKKYFPVEACEFISREHLPGTFYNEDGFGGYWIWHFDTARPVFLDGRFHTVDGYIELYQEVHAAQSASPEVWESLLDRYGIDAALVAYPDHPLFPSVFQMFFPRARWALIYWDDVGLIFVRRKPEFDRWIKRYEFKAVDPDGTLEHLKAQIQNPGKTYAAIHEELLRNEAAHPDSWRVNALLRYAAEFHQGS